MLTQMNPTKRHIWEIPMVDDKYKLMMEKFLNTFYIKDSLESSLQIIRFWESKRLLFNIVNLCMLLLGFLLIYLTLPFLVNFFIMPFVVAYWILLNVLYFLGWFFLVVIKRVWISVDITIGASILLIANILLSSVFTFGICILYLIVNIP